MFNNSYEEKLKASSKKDMMISVMKIARQLHSKEYSSEDSSGLIERLHSISPFFRGQARSLRSDKEASTEDILKKSNEDDQANVDW